MAAIAYFKKIVELTKKNILLMVAAILLLAAFSIFCLVYLGYQKSFGKEFINTAIEQWDQSQWGTMGDFFGGVLNPMFGFITLVFLFFTIYIQSRELAHSKKALAEQGKTQELQRFENTFFQLLRLLVDTKEGLHPSAIYEGARGLATFKSVFESFRIVYEEELESKDTHLPENDKESIFRAYKKMFDKEKSLEHYLRLIYNIIKLVDQQFRAKDDEESDRAYISAKGMYINIIRAQLTDYELKLLFYNVWYFAEIKKRPKFKILVERYGLFEDIEPSMLLRASHYADPYKPEAYGKENSPQSEGTTP